MADDLVYKRGLIILKDTDNFFCIIERHTLNLNRHHLPRNQTQGERVDLQQQFFLLVQASPCFSTLHSMPIAHSYNSMLTPASTTAAGVFSPTVTVANSLFPGLCSHPGMWMRSLMQSTPEMLTSHWLVLFALQYVVLSGMVRRSAEENTPLQEW